MGCGSLKYPAVFLDRDGTLIVEKHYLSNPDQVVLLEGVIDGLRTLQEFGLPLIVVSNQSGIGRGYFSRQDAEAVNDRIALELAPHGINIDGWYMCPHAPDSGCNCRKPLPGLIEQASRDLSLDPSLSFVVGDKRADLDLARAVGAIPLIVTTGYGTGEVDYARSLGVPICQTLVEVSSIVSAKLRREST